MKTKNQTKITVIVFAPIAIFTLSFITITPRGFTEGSVFTTIINIIGFLWIVGLVVYSIVQVRINDDLSVTSKRLWMLALVITHFFGVIYYWYLYTRHSSKNEE